MVRVGVLHSSDQRLERRLIHYDSPRFHLNDQSRGIEAQGSATCHDVYAVIRARRGDVHQVALTLENFGDKPSKIVTREGACYLPFNLVPRKLCEITIYIGIGVGVDAVATIGMRLDVLEILKQSYPDRKPKTQLNLAAQLNQFCNQIRSATLPSFH